MTGHILAGAALGTVYLLLVLARPLHRCFRCHGKRVIRDGRRVSRCSWCRGTGWCRWPFATAIHRFWWSAAGNRRMERRKNQLAARPGDSARRPADRTED